MRFESDLARIREEPIRLKALKEDLEKLTVSVERLKALRQDLNQVKALSFDEFVRSQKRVQLSEENKARLQEAHQQHVQLQDRQRQDAQSRLENARQRLNDLLNSAQQKAEAEHEQRQQLERSMRKLVDALGAASDRLRIGASQLTLEQISQLEGDLEQHDWLKKTI